MKLWQKDKVSLKEVEKFTVGNDRDLDIYLAPFDVLGSLAHTQMLESIGLLTKDELTQLLTGHSIIIKTDKLHSQSFARYLATVFVGTADGWISVADHMIGKGFNVKQGL